MGHGQQPNNNPGKPIVQQIRLEEIEDDVEPPPPRLTSKFKTLEDWLLNICENDKPKKSITKYKFGLFESPNNHTLFLVGVNTHDEGENRSVTHIEFQPTNMYFKLPGNDYKNLDREQLLDQLGSQLKDFANTQTFKTSFFTKANVVVFETNGQTIWSK